MKNYLRKKSLEDYIVWIVGSLFIFGFALFIIGFFWGVEGPVANLNGLGKTSILKFLKIDNINYPLYTIPNGGMIENTNLFTLIKTLNPSIGLIYSMAILSVVGFSFIMLDIIIVIGLIIVTFILEMIIPKIKSKK
ncbi:MAG: hypothetical protein HRS50_01220 [Mycoplasmataceae bacterium]|nr:hypothetical protein [Mycoplasmataceae bacterium]